MEYEASGADTPSLLPQSNASANSDYDKRTGLSSTYPNKKNRLMCLRILHRIFYEQIAEFSMISANFIRLEDDSLITLGAIRRPGRSNTDCEV
jgi:hypothetical protein